MKDPKFISSKNLPSDGIVEPKDIIMVTRKIGYQRIEEIGQSLETGFEFCLSTDLTSWIILPLQKGQFYYRKAQVSPNGWAY